MAGSSSSTRADTAMVVHVPTSAAARLIVATWRVRCSAMSADSLT